jgi:hypothetical protein
MTTTPTQDADTELDGENPLTAELEALKGEMEQLRAEALRERADLDNQRKRLARELDTARKFANERLLGELLPLFDSMEAGLAAAAQNDPLREGLELTLRQLHRLAAPSSPAAWLAGGVSSAIAVIWARTCALGFCPGQAPFCARPSVLTALGDWLSWPPDTQIGRPSRVRAAGSRAESSTALPAEGRGRRAVPTCSQGWATRTQEDYEPWERSSASTSARPTRSWRSWRARSPRSSRTRKAGG